MSNCQFCHTELCVNARFCHHCGTKVNQPNLHCKQCFQENEADASFCVNCGSAIGVIPTQSFSTERDTLYEPKYALNFRKVKELGSKIRQYFVVELDKRIQGFHNSANKEAYLNHLMRSDFQEIFKLRTDQLAEETYGIHSNQQPNMDMEIDMVLTNAFEGLLDFFLIKYCKDINEVSIPETILRYEGIPLEDIDLFQLVNDYLALEEEEVAYYTDFLKMPLKKLQNAGRYYLFPDKEEKILLICDQTVFGSCKEGFAITEAAIYWKAHFKSAQKVLFKEIDELQNQGEHILINDKFFNAGKIINIKMIYLLNRLKRMF